MTPHEAACFRHWEVERDDLETQHRRLGALLRAMATGPNGLTLDAVKATPEWRGLRLAASQAFGRLQATNGIIVATRRGRN